MRPLAHNLKDKIKRELPQQEASGIIGKIFSEWASALTVIHNQDGSIRITVDYTPFNKVIKQDSYVFPNSASPVETV